MSTLHRLNRRIRAIFLHRRVERELDEELTFHLQMEAEYNERRGLDPSRARAAALRDFGVMLRVKEEAREVRGIQILENIAADVRYAARWLRASPAFTTVAAATIALGIGGTTAMFSLADEVLLSPLPVRAPEQLYFINSVGPDPDRGGMIPYPLLQRFQANESFRAVSATAEDHLPVFIDDEPEQALTQIASGNFYQMLGVEPALGRLLTPEDEQFPASVAVLSHDYWQRRFGGSPAVLGRVIRVGEQRVTIVGVTRNGYTGIQTGRRIDITVPITFVGEEMIRSHSASFFSVMGRLQPDAAVRRAESELEAIYRGYLTELGRSNDERVRPYHMQLEPASHGGGRLRAQFARPIWILLALTIGVLTIACANIANLLLARGAARQQELSIRVAIGAGRRRIIQQFLTETLLLFALGSIFGLVVAMLLGRTLSDFFAIGRLPVVLDIDLDARALAFAAAACLVTGIVAGLAPALRAARRDTASELRQRGTSRSTLPVSRSLVIVQVALAITILVAGSLLIATLARLRAIDPGFRTHGILTMSIHLLRDPASPAEADVLWSSMQQQVSALRGVEAAGLAVLTPLSGRDSERRVRVPGFVRPLDPRRPDSWQPNVSADADAQGSTARESRHSDQRCDDDRATAGLRAHARAIAFGYCCRIRCAGLVARRDRALRPRLVHRDKSAE
jgi:predicted permease